MTAQMKDGSARRWRFWSWLLIFGLGALKLCFPLWGDQALFLFYAHGMAKGLQLYVDLWDIKQPGIFWFYFVAGKAFEFTAVGVHVVEWLWLGCAALLLRWAASIAFINAWVAELVPLLTIGLYYWCAGPFFMTQVEILVTLPLAGCLLASTLGSAHRGRAPWMHALFGACTAMVITFKLVLVVVPVALWLVWVGYALASHPRPASNVMRGMLFPALLGTAIPIVLVALRLAHDGSWNAFAWTTFTWPRLALQEHDGKSLAVLFAAARWIVAVSLPGLVLVAMVRGDIQRQPLRQIEAQALAWLIAGVLVILVQRISWWGYHFLLILPAVGLIGASACDRLAARSNAFPHRNAIGVEHIAALGVAAMFALYPVQTWRGLRAAAEAAVAPAGERLDTFRGALDTRYLERRDTIVKLREQVGDRGKDRSAVYVFGDPNWMLQFDRPQAIPFHGWMWELMLPTQWAMLPAELEAAAPQYIYVDAPYAELIGRTAPAVSALIEREYRPVLATTELGIWYLRAGSSRTHVRDSKPDHR